MAPVRRHTKSGRWQVRYRDPSGRQRAKNFERKVDANKFRATVTADVYRGEYVDPQLGRTTFETSVRTIPIPADLVERLQEHMASTVPHISGLLFSVHAGARSGTRIGVRVPGLGLSSGPA